MSNSIQIKEPETWETYQRILRTRAPSKDAWIYGILDGKTERDQVLYTDDKFLLVPPLLRTSAAGVREYPIFSRSNPTHLHLMAIPFDRSLRTIRDIRKQHLPLLKYMYEKTLAFIKDNYGLSEEQLDLEFHYVPSAYHLHLHFKSKFEGKVTEDALIIVHPFREVFRKIKANELFYKEFPVTKLTWSRGAASDAGSPTTPATPVTPATPSSAGGSYKLTNLSEAEIVTHVRQIIDRNSVQLRLILVDSEEVSGILCGVDKIKGTITLRGCSRLIPGTTKINVNNIFGGGSKGESKESESERVFETTKVLDIIDLLA